jgi:hypothetical protein
VEPVHHVKLIDNFIEWGRIIFDGQQGVIVLRDGRCRTSRAHGVVGLHSSRFSMNVCRKSTMNSVAYIYTNVFSVDEIRMTRVCVFFDNGMVLRCFSTPY